MRVLLVLAAMALTACGVDGAPVKPSLNVGVQVGPNGIKPRVAAQVRKGPVVVGTQGAGVTF